MRFVISAIVILSLYVANEYVHEMEIARVKNEKILVQDELVYCKERLSMWGKYAKKVGMYK